MIKSFKHKGLELFYYTGNRKRINPDHYKKVSRILDRLDSKKGKDIRVSANFIAIFYREKSPNRTPRNGILTDTPDKDYYSPNVW